MLNLFQHPGIERLIDYALHQPFVTSALSAQLLRLFCAKWYFLPKEERRKSTEDQFIKKAGSINEPAFNIDVNLVSDALDLF